MAMADMPSTVIVNNTKKDLDMKVGNHHYFADFTSVRSGAKHTMRIDYNDTYQEFLIAGVGNSEDVDVGKKKKLIVTSDDCCDYKCITITEDVDGHFHVHKVPRRRPSRPANQLQLRRVPVKKMKVSLFNWGLMCQ